MTDFAVTGGLHYHVAYNNTIHTNVDFIPKSWFDTIVKANTQFK